MLAMQDVSWLNVLYGIVGGAFFLIAVVVAWPGCGLEDCDPDEGGRP